MTVRSATTQISLGIRPVWSESSLGTHAVLLVLSWGGSFFTHTRQSLTFVPFRAIAGQIGFLVVVLGSALLIFNIESASSTPEHCHYDINLTATADCHYKYDFRRSKEIPNCIPNTTKELIFHGNDLTYQPGQLQRFTFLTYLDLSFNGKFTPSCDSFDGLTQLKTLDLSSTNLTHLKPYAFSKLTNLETLSLSCSNMQNVTADIFATLNNLKKNGFIR